MILMAHCGITLDISSLQPPFRRVGDDVVEDACGTRVVLSRGVREFLASARKLGLIVASLSWNDPTIALEAIEAFGLNCLFDEHFIEPHPRKGEVMARALKILSEKLGVRLKPESIVYIDYRDIHIGETKEKVGNVLFLQAWRDFKDFSEACKLIASRISLEEQ